VKLVAGFFAATTRAADEIQQLIGVAHAVADDSMWVQVSKRVIARDRAMQLRDIQSASARLLDLWFRHRAAWPRVRAA